MSQRRPIPSRKTDRLLDLRILPGHWSQQFCRELCRPIHYCSSKWRYSGIRFQVGTEFYCQWRKSHLMTSWKVCTNKEFESLRNSRLYWNCTIWRFIWRRLDLIVTDWKLWWKEVSSKKFEIIILGSEMEILRRTPWSRIREQNSVYKEFLEIVGNGNPTGSVRKETIAVSDTIWISVQNRHRRTLLQDLLRSRVWKMRREPEVPEARVPVVEWLDGPARITSKELSQLHSVKKWHPPECLFYKSEKRMQISPKSALTHTARLTNSLARSRKRMVTKVQWLHCKFHDTWVAYVKIWSRRSLHRFCGRAQTYRGQSDVFNSPKPYCVTLTFKTKIHRLEWFAQVNLIPGEPHQCNPNAQNLRIGLKKRRNGKSDVLVKQRGGWPKFSEN